MPRHAPRPLDRVRIAAPCDASWDAMEGNERVRFCQHCSLHVHDTSRMTPAEAFDLVLRSGGRLCLRLHRRPDGTLVTRTPPPPLYQIRRRASRLAAGAFGAALTLCSAAVAQAQTSQTPAPVAATEQARGAAGPGAGGTLVGMVTDPNGSVIPNARVSLTNDQTGAVREVFTDDAGLYRLDSLDAGGYTLRASGPEGLTPEERRVSVFAGVQHNVNVQMFDGQVLGGSVAFVEPLDPFVNAAFENNLVAVREMLAGGADVNVVDEAMGVSALAVAVNQGNRELMIELLRAGAEVNARLAYKQTALMRVSVRTTGEIVRELLLADAKVNVRDEDGNTPLMAAAAYAPTEVVELLLKAGARADVRAKSSETPLMRAARAGATANVRALLSAGADLEARNDAGETALALAREHEHEETADLLVAYGATDEARPQETEAGEVGETPPPR